jgi:hypothetical protein
LLSSFLAAEQAAEPAPGAAEIAETTEVEPAHRLL